MNERKQSKSGPLPFQGQKRNFIKHFSEVIKSYPNNATYIDLFGGSGLLSHTVRYIHSQATVVYNDFDNYCKRLQAIPQTNRILDELRALNLQTPRGKQIYGSEKEAVCEILRRANERGFVDWITLSASLKFSMNYGIKLEDFTKSTLYNSIRNSNYETAEDYLAGIEIVSENYKDVYQKYKNMNNVVFLVDPPYLSTNTDTYSNKSYWHLTEYLEILDTLHNANNYFYFTSNKSQIVELCQWMETRTANNVNPFKHAICTAVNNIIYNSNYTDLMYHYKKKEE